MFIFSPSSQAFELWKLKHHRRQVLYRILDSRARKTRRKKAFLAWREHTQRSAEAQREGVRLIERVQMGVMMSAWQSWTSIQICHRYVHMICFIPSMKQRILSLMYT